MYCHDLHDLAPRVGRECNVLVLGLKVGVLPRRLPGDALAPLAPNLHSADILALYLSIIPPCWKNDSVAATLIR